MIGNYLIPLAPRFQSQLGLQAALEDIIREKELWLMRNREQLVEAWLAETGCSAVDAVLVEQRIHDETLIWVERRRPFNDQGAGI
jgi:hypothetical protein